MSVIVIALFWIMFCYLSVKPVQLLLYSFFISLAFGSFAVVPPNLVGGLTITPTSALSVLLVVKILGNTAGVQFLLKATCSVFRLKLLCAYWLLAIFTTLFMTRLYAGEIWVFSLRDLEIDLLRPSMQNVSQLLYVTISTALVFTFAKIFALERQTEFFILPLCFLAIVLVASAIMDYMAPEYILDGFRNASYSIASDQRVFDGKRAIGLMPEPSSFAVRCVSVASVLWFVRPLCESSALRNHYVPLLVLLLFTCVWMSKSTTGFIGIIAFLSVLLISKSWTIYRYLKSSLMNSNNRFGLCLVRLALFLIVSSTSLLSFYVLFTDNVHSMYRLVDLMLFNKTDSHSFEERSYWTSVSWTAFLDSGLLGVGLGSTRASSSIVSVISSVGILGALLLYSQMLILCTRRGLSSKSEEKIVRFYTMSVLPIFVMGAVSSTSADIGPIMAFLLGTAASVKVLGANIRVTFWK